MPKRAWNTFVVAHPTAICVFGAISGKDVKAGALDRRGIKLPKAYGLTTAVLAKVLQDDWAIQRSIKSLHILLSTRADLARLNEAIRLGPSNVSTLPAPCAVAYGFVFDAQLYKRWATGLGYVL